MKTVLSSVFTLIFLGFCFMFGGLLYWGGESQVRSIECVREFDEVQLCVDKGGVPIVSKYSPNHLLDCKL